jgi:protein involved in polysaccharide export with SLBB domain
MAGLFVVGSAVLCLTVFRPAPAPPTGWSATQRASSGATYILGGKVRRPGMYTVGDNPVTVRQALELAGGAEEGIGDGSFVTIYRRHPEERELIKIRLHPLVREGVNDEALWPNDQVLVHDKP